jgi:hypothetical protein
MILSSFVSIGNWVLTWQLYFKIGYLMMAFKPSKDRFVHRTLAIAIETEIFSTFGF